MSTYVCNPAHTAALASFVRDQQRDGNAFGYPNDPADIAELWARENLRSVTHRYCLGPNAIDTALPDGCTTVDDYVTRCRNLTSSDFAIDPVEALSMIAWLEYQISEAPNYRQTEAYRLLQRVRHLAIANLPGYSDAPCEFTGRRSDRRAAIDTTAP